MLVSRPRYFAEIRLQQCTTRPTAPLLDDVILHTDRLLTVVSRCCISNNVFEMPSLQIHYRQSTTPNDSITLCTAAPSLSDGLVYGKYCTAAVTKLIPK